MRSDHGIVRARVRADATLRPGVVSMTRGWGGLRGDDPDAPGVGANVNAQTSSAGPTLAVSRQPMMTALPVDVTVLERNDLSP